MPKPANRLRSPRASTLRTLSRWGALVKRVPFTFPDPGRRQLPGA
jgi:hypothetical protein